MGRVLRSMALDVEALDCLMPMHIQISGTGHIARVGPTITKMRPEIGFVGKRFLEVFELRRPHTDVNGRQDLNRMIGAKLSLVFRSEPRTGLKGVLVPFEGTDTLLLNMSFGMSAADAVRDYALTIGDFAVTDLTVELLYLFEAKSVVMEEIAQLNDRLTAARLTAEEQATTDALTGLKNRRAMDKKLAGLVFEHHDFGLMHLDLDYFKNVNDTFGHAAGDAVLQAAARVLIDETRMIDTVARVGGDEFVLIFLDIIDEARLQGIADRIVARLEEPVDFQGQICRVSGSIGITTSRFNETPDANLMMSDADVALYASKHNGRACATLATRELLKATNATDQ